ncbi:MAG: ATP-dependent RNA helicase RhlE, partial [Bacteroidia bacterium]|nr:ATP-dependent RNA helicase RhlE [Bacteroidia bacterium]
IKELASKFLHHPVMVEATPENTTVEVIAQKVYRVDKGMKTKLLIKLISEGSWKQVLVFTRTKHGANKLSVKLQKAGITSAAIHGNKSQGARTQALAGFKKNKVRVLVATDIAARGLDIPLLPHVVNFELPNFAEDYVHRIRRTGRAGQSGEAISLVCIDEVSYLKGIERLIKQQIEKEILKGFEPEDIPSEKKKSGGRKPPRRKFGNSSGKSSGKSRNFKKKKKAS